MEIKPVTPSLAKNTKNMGMKTTIPDTRDNPKNKKNLLNKRTKNLDEDGDVIMSDNQQGGKRLEREKAINKK